MYGSVHGCMGGGDVSDVLGDIEGVRRRRRIGGLGLCHWLRSGLALVCNGFCS